MAVIIIGLSRPKKWKIFSELIMWGDKHLDKAEVRMSHGYSRFIGRAWERDFIYQAAGLATNFCGSHHFETGNVIVEEYEHEVQAEVDAKFGRICVDREGKPYGIKQATGNIIAGLVRLFSGGAIKIKNPFADGQDSVTCIEEQGYLLCEAVGITPPKELETMGVWEFRNFVRNLPGIKVRVSNVV
jgi:hypothetical protein